MQASSVTGTFQTGNTTFFNTTFVDTCTSNTTIMEFICGGSISPQYNSLAGAVLEDCGAINGTNTTLRCVSGRCQ